MHSTQYMSILNILLAGYGLWYLVRTIKSMEYPRAYELVSMVFILKLSAIIIAQGYDLVYPYSHWFLKISAMLGAISVILFTKLILKAMSKNVAFFNESTSDTWVSITTNGNTYPVNTVVSSLPTTPGSDHVFQADDTNGVTDACAVIGTNATANGLFQRSDMSTYSLNSNDFISGGSHPPVRPS